jgi:hypothetical protein
VELDTKLPAEFLNQRLIAPFFVWSHSGNEKMPTVTPTTCPPSPASEGQSLVYLVYLILDYFLEAP